jgi:hypothetical protein
MQTSTLMRIAPFLIGTVLGVLGTIYLPGAVRPHLPEWAAGGSAVVTGTVAAKQKKDAALLLTVETPTGVLLATFTRKVDEINLLINETDTIEFNLAAYKPFVDDPRIVRVTKAKQAAPEPAPAPERVEKKDGEKKDVRPKKQERPPAAAPAPAPATRTTGTPS